MLSKNKTERRTVVVHLPWEQKVTGSSPVVPTISLPIPCRPVRIRIPFRNTYANLAITS